MTNEIGQSSYDYEMSMSLPPMANFNEGGDNYAKTMSFIWPLKALWNIPILAFWFVVNTPALTGLTIRKLLTGIAKPVRLLHKRLSKKPPEQLSAAELGLDQFDIDEYHSLLMERDKVNARLKELEAHPDKGKLLQMARRL